MTPVCMAVAVPIAYATHQPPLSALAGVAVLCAALGIGVGLAIRRYTLRRLDHLLAAHGAESLRFDTAINNISQGLCFFDGQQRLIV